MSTYAGVVREVPIVSFAVAAASTLVRGQAVQWNSSTHVVEALSVGTNKVLGVTTSDADLNLKTIDVYCGKGASVLVKCGTGIIPNPGDTLFYSASGAAITGTAGQGFATAIGVGMNGFVEAILS